eukprot:CAMPEP_0181115498 /NCGR_PEP_ID=MMETSP1071-20121207/21463_1 /TAXON_ID=35127 /ORGANISM="Thalassiosira sp., Strain NH16" /LENGTH=350 /DNA_ID=CAMNT_0023199707 /DNA_START=311 /DNA_END=1363 /DNA_ORIENTATION=-
MTTIYVASTRRICRKPSRKAANAKKPPEDTPSSSSSSAGKLKSFVGGGTELVDGLLSGSLDRVECLNNNDDPDDSIEVQFLDSLLDDSDRPIVPSMCPADPDDGMADRSLDVSTDATHVNTSAEEESHGFLSFSMAACGKGGDDSSFASTDRKEAKQNDGHDSFSDLEKNNSPPLADPKRNGWVPRAFANVLDNVIDSNWLCQTTNRSGPHAPEYFKGKDKKRNRKPRRKKSKSRVSKAMPLPSPLVPSPSDNAESIKKAFDQAQFQTSKDLFHGKEGETTPKTKTIDTEETSETTPVSYPDEPVVGRQLFSLEDQLGLLNDGDEGSRSTVMTSNNSVAASVRRSHLLNA